MTPPYALTPDVPNLVINGDNGDVVPALPDGAFQMIYVDPPFNTGRKQSRQSIKTVRSATRHACWLQGSDVRDDQGHCHRL